MAEMRPKFNEKDSMSNIPMCEHEVLAVCEIARKP
jgi:hypothetical protein